MFIENINDVVRLSEVKKRGEAGRQLRLCRKKQRGVSESAATD
jgi:hypothetical protein